MFLVVVSFALHNNGGIIYIMLENVKEKLIYFLILNIIYYFYCDNPYLRIFLDIIKT